MDSEQGSVANSDLEGQPAGLAGVVSLGDVVDVTQWITPRQAVFTPQHADQQSDQRITHRLLTGALAQSFIRQLVSDHIQALDSGRVHHHSSGAETSTDAVLHGSRTSLEHSEVVISRSDWTANKFRSPPEDQAGPAQHLDQVQKPMQGRGLPPIDDAAVRG